MGTPDGSSMMHWYFIAAVAMLYVIFLMVMIQSTKA
jgi:hypothetical protein